MQIDHLADAMDHWKGAMVEMLDGIACDLHVVPMLTDFIEAGNPWQESHFKLYARLLKVPLDHVLLRDRPFRHADRQSYFGQVCLKGEFDLLLDPNTGIETPTSCDDRHIRLDDLAVLIPPNECSRLLLVYQHSQPYNMRDSILNRLPAIQERWPSFAFWAGAVSMVFVSSDNARITACQNRVCEWLGPCARMGNDCPIRLLA